MFFLKEFRDTSRSRHVADLLPWAFFEARGVMRLKSGGLMRMMTYRGKDPQSLSDSERVVMADQVNTILQSLGTGWSVFHEVERQPLIEPVHGTPPLGAAGLVEEIRQENFRASGRLFTTTYRLTFVYHPKVKAGGKLVERIAGFFGGFFEGGVDAEYDEMSQEEQRRREELEAFCRVTRQAYQSLSGLLAATAWLDDEGVLTTLHRMVSTNHHPISVPDPAMYLDGILADEVLQIGTEMTMGNHHVRVVSVLGYPDFTQPRMLSALEHLTFPFRMVSRYIGLDQFESLKALGSYQNLLASQVEKSNPLIKKGSEQSIDQDKLMQSREVGMAVSRCKAQRITFGHHSLAVVIVAPSPKLCQQRSEDLMTQLRRRGFACVEEQPNLEDAFFSTLPGHIWANSRRPLVSSKNMSHMTSLEAVWTGSPENTHLGGPPHILCATQGSQPFFLNLNVNDVGHSMVLGPTGGGKSTLLTSLALQWMKYRDAQVFFFDKGRSSRVSTLCMGGTFIELSVKQTQVTFQPLARIDEPGEFEFCLTWLEELFSLEGVHVDAELRSVMRTALDSMRSTPKSMRTLTTLWLGLQHPDLRLALEPYCRGSQGKGPYADMWDNADEHFGVTRFTALELGELMDSSPRLIAITLRYVFHRLEKRFEDGHPTLLILDEAWIFLDHPLFAPRMRLWLKTLRKYNVYVVFATQELVDALNSSIAPTLIQNCPTKILLANSQSMNPDIQESYKRLGLTLPQIETLSRLNTTDGEDKDVQYFFYNTLGSRVFRLGLSPLELALAGNSPEVQARLDAAIRLAHSRGESVCATYLEASGFTHYANQIRMQSMQQGV